MATRSEVEMSDAEVDALLSRHETGVLALARDETPYAIPISYGFDKESRTAFLRLVSTPDSEKREFLASDPQARIVVYEEGDIREVARSTPASSASGRSTGSTSTIHAPDDRAVRQDPTPPVRDLGRREGRPRHRAVPVRT